MSAARTWLGRLALVVGGLLGGLLAVELGARLARPHDAADLLFNAPDNAPDGLYTSSRTLVQVPTPGFRGVQSSLGYRVDLRVNSLSLRGGEPGPKQGPRWLALGDSFTFAAQVSEADSFVQRLAQALDVEVFNAGADGYGTWPALLRYQQLDPVLDVDGVLLTFFVGNDLTDNQMWAGMAQRASQMPHELPLFRRPEHPLRSLLAHNSYVYGQWQMRQRQAAFAQVDSDERRRWRGELALFTEGGQAQLEQRLPDTRQALRALRDAVADRGDRLVVAVAPPAFQIDADRLAATMALVGFEDQRLAVDGPSDQVHATLAQLGIDACDLVVPLRSAAQQGQQTYLRYDGHWSPAGHRVVADALAACLGPG